MAQQYWATQSPVTEPGGASSAIDALPADLAALRHASSQLIFHYRAGDFAKYGVPTERRSEINLRYADAMLDVILSRGAEAVTQGGKSSDGETAGRMLLGDRHPINRLVGCCRDSTVLFLALARRKGIPARGRVGFASYIVDGWFLDHVVAEVWDEKEGRWRLVEPLIGASTQTDGGGDGGKRVDFLDLTDEEFITGPRAWQLARARKTDANRYVVAPDLDLPFLRGWPYLAHNLVHDLTWLTKREMLLWDTWGLQERLMEGPIADDLAELFDEISAVTVKPMVERAVLEDLISRDGLRVPRVVVSADPNGGPMRNVDVARAIGG